MWEYVTIGHMPKDTPPTISDINDPADKPRPRFCVVVELEDPDLSADLMDLFYNHILLDDIYYVHDPRDDILEFYLWANDEQDAVDVISEHLGHMVEPEYVYKITKVLSADLCDMEPGQSL